jgi:hypothetical protein
MGPGIAAWASPSPAPPRSVPSAATPGSRAGRGDDEVTRWRPATRPCSSPWSWVPCT